VLTGESYSQRKILPATAVQIAKVRTSAPMAGNWSDQAPPFQILCSGLGEAVKR
jgi:hypothetical protein